MVVATIEIVIVQTVEVIFLRIVQFFITLLILYGDTRVTLVVDQEEVVTERNTIGGNLLLAESEGRGKLSHQS